MPPSASTHALPDEVLALIAARFKALSEPLRLKLIISLEGGERNVSELVEATGATQANASRQLQILADAGVLTRRKQGVSVYYQIADPAIFDLCQHVCGSLQKDYQRKEVASKLLAQHVNPGAMRRA